MLDNRSAKVQNENMIAWDDLRHFLAVARTGSTLAGGRSLRVSQTTTSRRVSALEDAIGFALFERKPSGFTITPAGQTLLEHAEAAESAVERFTDCAGGQVRDISGLVRVTALDIYAFTLLTPLLSDLHRRHPSLRIELDTSDQARDLAEGAADVALRVGIAPSGRGIVRRKLAVDSWTLYCSRSYAAAHKKPSSAADLRQHSFVGGGGPEVWRRYSSWLKRHKLEEAVVIHYSTCPGLLAAVRAGSGFAVLPCFVADQDEELVRCLEPVANEASGLWLVTHERVRHSPQVRAVYDFLAEQLSEMARAKRLDCSDAWIVAS
ncbi:LysR family transcriptional regulator [Sphingomonas sp.]|uniref:LysR family transcriptional regulator n=1 Tax=Sphingomonas sp. TaxID=28214 RepID=UPI0025CF62F0|nr:LysR family transcriptional regulator [Sphingomonas sp.]